MVQTSFASRWLPLLAAAVLFGAATPALADCQEEMSKLMQRRQGMLEGLSKLKAGKNQLDPIAACPKLRALAGVEGEVVSYLEKNKDWCNVPDNFLDNAKAGRAKSQAFAAKACQIAAQVQKMKQQQAQGGGAVGGPQVQKLPTGPL